MIIAALNAQMALIHAGKSDLGEGYFDSCTYYQGLLLMELSSISKKNLKKTNTTENNIEEKTIK